LSRESTLSTHDKNIQNSFTGQNPAPSVSGSPLLTLDAFELQHDPQRGRDLSHILLAFSGAFEQAGKLAPGELRAVFLGQVFLDQDPDVAERRKLHDVRDDDRAWQRPRPVRSGQGTKLGSPASSANQCQASDRKLCQRSVSAIGWLEIALRGTNWGSEDRVKITSRSCSIDRCQQPLDFLFHPLALALLSGRARLPRSARSAAL
jgi:hypothetical protein